MAPTLTLTLPRNVFGSTTSASSAPGRQPTTCVGSTRYAKARTAGALTTNRSSIRKPTSLASCPREGLGRGVEGEEHAAVAARHAADGGADGQLGEAAA